MALRNGKTTSAYKPVRAFIAYKPVRAFAYKPVRAIISIGNAG